MDEELVKKFLSKRKPEQYKSCVEVKCGKGVISSVGGGNAMASCAVHGYKEMFYVGN